VAQEDLDTVPETYEQAEDIGLAEGMVLVARGHTVAAVVGVVHKIDCTLLVWLKILY
jgi:hypothetical protein